MGSLQMSPDWLEKIYGATDAFFADRLGPDIANDARRLCPKRTGALAESIEDHLNGHDLVVSATGSEEREYAYFVEEGHQIAHGPGMKIVGPQRKAPEPFLRPSLYADRSY
jgi:hypothetical protein